MSNWGVALVVLVATGLGAGTAAGAATRVVIGYNDTAPLVIHEASGGDASGGRSGFLVEVLTEAARREDITLEWRLYNRMLPEENRPMTDVDLWVAAMATPERRRFNYFTTPWWKVEMQVLGRAGIGLEQGRYAGKRIAFHDLAPLREMAEKYLHAATLDPHPSSAAAVQAMCTGKADAVFSGHLYLHRILLDRPPGCSGASLTLTSTPDATMDLSLVSTFAARDVANRLRSRIDEMASEGTLLAIAARYPLVSYRAGEHLSALAKIRYERNLLRYGLTAACLLLFLVSGLLFELRADIKSRKQAQTAARRRERQLEVLSRTSREIHAVLEPRSVLQTLAASAAKLTEARGGFCTLNYGEGRLDAVEGPPRATNAEVVARSLSASRAAVLVFGRRGQRIGSIEVYDGSRAFTDDDLILLESLASAGAIALENALMLAERERLEEQLRQAQKMEAIGRLAGGVAHDFNNILTVIHGYCRLGMSQLAANDPLRGYLAEVLQAGERAARLTQQLLAFSRKQMLQLTVIDLNLVVDGVTGLLERLIEEPVRVVRRLDPAAAYVKADISQLEQVILNLAVNARDAMPHGGVVTIETSCAQLAASGDTEAGQYVRLTMRDTGHGMDEQTRRKVFEPFFTTKAVGKGTGLGLSTVYGIVKQSGGHIEVESEPGQGTAFHIYLPRIEGASAETDKETPEAAPGNETILLAEDQADVRRLVTTILQSAGYRVLAAENAAAAEKIAAEFTETIDLLLTDVVMPDTAGPELAARLRARHSALRVIFMSGYTGDRAALDNGVPYLEKPFTLRRLLGVVRQVLDAPPGDESRQ